MFNEDEINESRELAAMDAASYHRAPAFSASLARTILQKSPLHAWLDSPLNQNRESKEPSDAMLRGTAAHALILEGRNTLSVIDANDYRTKAAQEAKNAALEAGQYPILSGKVDEFMIMCTTARRAIQSALNLNLDADGQAEVTLRWREGETPCKARPDWLKSDASIILDLKITELGSPSAWQRGISASGYDIQAAHYVRGVRMALEQQATFIFAVVEAIPPYPVYFIELDAAFMAIADAKRERALKIWTACVEANKFPCYPTEVILCEPPNWEMAKAEQDEQEFAAWTVEGFLFGRVPNVD